MLWLQLITAIPTLWVSPAHIIMVRLCDGCFLYAICSCGTVSSSNSIHRKITLAVWRRIPHITYTVYLPITEGFLMNYSIMFHYQLLDIGHLYKYASTFSHVNKASKLLFVSAIDRYVTFQHRSSLMQACKVRSKPRWSCMGTHGSTMLPDPLKLGWEDDEMGDWIPLRTTPPDVNAVCMELTKCSSMRAV